MSSTQNKPQLTPRLFKMFTIHQEAPPSPISLLQSKVVSFPCTPQASKTPSTPKTLQTTAIRKSQVGSPQNQQVESRLADFKKYLHKSSLMNKQPSAVVEVRGRSKSNAERQQMKERLQKKIKQAHQKLEEIKSTLKKYQQEKSEIINKSEKRRASITKSTLIHQPTTS